MARPKRVTAKLRLVERPDGLAQVEIVTSRRLEPFHRWTWIGWDYKRQEHLWEDGGVQAPEEYLRDPSVFGTMVSGPEPGRWRYVSVRVSAPLEGVMTNLVQREVDLSEGSEERRVFAVLAKQEQIPIVWVKEEVETTHPSPEDQRANWLVALENTRGVSAKEWTEELAELTWQRSASWRHGRPRPGSYKPRTAAPPAVPLAFFAPRSGRIPRARGAEVAGVRLPAGRRYPRGLPAAYWASVEPVPNAERIASQLASAFSESGLWPLLWRFHEDPDAYLGGHGDLDAIDRIDVEEILQQSWSQTPWPPGSTEPFTEFPGLAPAAKHRSAPLNPFASERVGADACLLLVPCNRPADAITMLGGLAVVEAPAISAVLRSWEERFFATAYEVAPDLVKLSVAAPPATEEHALLVAAEHMAFCPPDDGGAPGALRKVAGGLLVAEEGSTDESYRSSRERWYVGWYD